MQKKSESPKKRHNESPGTLKNICVDSDFEGKRDSDFERKGSDDISFTFLDTPKSQKN